MIINTKIVHDSKSEHYLEDLVRSSDVVEEYDVYSGDSVSIDFIADMRCKVLIICPKPLKID